MPFADLRVSFSLALLAMLGCRLEDRFIFYPSAEIVRTPLEAGLEFQEHYFKTADSVRLNGWFIPHPDARATLVWFHGNAGNISHRVENIKLLHDRVKINVFIFDYRGYGRSAGSVSEEGTYRDGVAALTFLQQHIGVRADRLIMFGRSLGAAIAAEMALRFKCRGLILESPFTSIRDMTKRVMPLLPVGALLQTRYDVVEKIAKIKVPLLVLHGDRDDLVPYEQGRQVFAAAPNPKAFYTINGANHNDTYRVGGVEYFNRLESFIDGVLATEPALTLSPDSPAKN